jgi:Transposase IS66 family
LRRRSACDAAGRLTARRDRSAAIVADLFKLWETELPRISGKSKLAEAIRYATSRREILGRFLLDGRIEIGRVDDWCGDRRSRGFTVSGCFRRSPVSQFAP